jgi:hypothetical protein
MSFFAQFVVDAYSKMLNLYPRRFKDEFAIEMYTVFKHSVMDAAEQGALALILVCGREFMGMPFNVLKEFWHEIQGEDIYMQDTSSAALRPGSWGDSVWAGLPHLLIAFAGLTAFVASTALAVFFGFLIVFVFLVGILVTIYFTWRKRWPVWTASWYGYAGLIILLFSILPSQGWAPPAEGLFRVIQLILLPLCLATLLYWLTRRNPIEALLMAMPVIIVYWVPVMEFIPNQIRNWLIFGIFIIIALTAITITRINTLRRAVWIVLGASVLGGLPISYARTYWQDIPFPYTPTIGQMAELFSVQWLASSALVISPILGWGIWNLSKRYGRDGSIAASLIIIGALANLWGQFRYWQWSSHQNFFDAFGFSLLQAPGRTWPAYAVYAGLIITLVGAIRLAIQAWTDSKVLSLCLIILPLVLPLFTMFPIYFGWHIIPAGLSFEFGELSQTYRLLIFFAGALLVVAGGWSVTRLYGDPIRAGAA